MDYVEKLTRYSAHFVDELVNSGLKEVIISPGSRSTPLAMTLSEHEGINEWVIIDERSAAYFALGLAKQTNRPVGLICTSGTAVANYFPAIVEAYYSRVPLVVLTADRPHELRDVGAPQAIDQIKIFGSFVKWFHEMALPEASANMLSYVRSIASRATFVSQTGNAGPVHLNFPFQEPLIPDFTLTNLWENDDIIPYNPLMNGEKKLTDQQINSIIAKIKNKEKGIIVVGPQMDDVLAESIVKLASHWKLPILADPLSQVRAGHHQKENIIECYDAFFRSKIVREHLKPDFMIRFGAMPVSKSYLFYVEESFDALQFIVENDEGYRDPTGNATEFIYADPSIVCTDLLQAIDHMKFSEDWLEKWQDINHIAKQYLLNQSVRPTLTEGESVRTALDEMYDQSCLYIGNSMAVRDLDTFFISSSKEISVLSNRGASGIDGMVSSSLGAAASSDRPVTLIIGDLSFYHDLNGLLTAKQYQLNITILLINNNGGGIFSFLPQVQNEKHFESLFGTPLDIDFEQVVDMYGGNYFSVHNESDLRDQLQLSYQHQGLSVIEVKTERDDNLTWRRQKWQDIEQALIQLLRGE